LLLYPYLWQLFFVFFRNLFCHLTFKCYFASFYPHRLSFSVVPIVFSIQNPSPFREVVTCICFRFYFLYLRFFFFVHLKFILKNCIIPNRLFHLHLVNNSLFFYRVYNQDFQRKL
jgi:hypothetical protein